MEVSSYKAEPILDDNIVEPKHEDNILCDTMSVMSRQSATVRGEEGEILVRNAYNLNL